MPKMNLFEFSLDGEGNAPGWDSVAPGTTMGVLNVPNDVYHAGGMLPHSLNPVLSASKANDALQLSPGFVYHDYLNRRADIRSGEPSKAMELGSLAHLVTLQPKGWDRGIERVSGFDDWKKKAAKDAKAAAQENGKIAVLDKDWEAICEMHRTFRNHNNATNLVDLSLGGWPEFSILWRDPLRDLETGELLYPDGVPPVMQCRPDFMPTRAAIKDGHPVVDFKTTVKQPGDWERDSFLYRNEDLRLAIYYEGISRLTGLSVIPYAYIVQQRDPPYNITVILLNLGDDEDSFANKWLYQGQEKLVFVKREWARSLKSGKWRLPKRIRNLSVIPPHDPTIRYVKLDAEASLEGAGIGEPADENEEIPDDEEV